MWAFFRPAKLAPVQSRPNGLSQIQMQCQSKPPRRWGAGPFHNTQFNPTPVCRRGISLRGRGAAGAGRVKSFENFLARPAGIEPATPGLEGRCSVQLSYGRARPKRNADFTFCRAGLSNIGGVRGWLGMGCGGRLRHLAPRPDPSDCGALSCEFGPGGSRGMSPRVKAAPPPQPVVYGTPSAQPRMGRGNFGAA